MHGIVEFVHAMVAVQLCLQDLDQVVGDIVEMLSSFRVVSCRRSRYRRSRRRATRSLSRWSRWWSPPASVLEGHISIEVIFHSRLSLDSNPVPLLRNLFLFVDGEALGLEDGVGLRLRCGIDVSAQVVEDAGKAQAERRLFHDGPTHARG